MSIESFINYAVANVFCAIVFVIMIIHDRLNIDRQEKQLKYDHALMAFAAYFLSDALWAAVESGVIPLNAFTAVLTNALNYVFMAAITYTWLIYVQAVERIKNRDNAKHRFAILFPFIISTVALIVTYIIDPHILLDEAYKQTTIFNVFLVGVPYIYLGAIIIYTVRMSSRAESRSERRAHLFVGFLPVMVVVFGLLQMIVAPNIPIFAYSGTVLMIIFYIQSMERQISTDPLTNLNNRGQLVRFVSQNGNLRVEGKTTFVVMVDVNDFKLINDNLGHAEGDSALVLIAQSLVAAIAKHTDLAVFLGRYGGDEFVMIVHAQKEDDLKSLIEDIRVTVRENCEHEGKRYIISVSVGYDELLSEQDTFTKCLARADTKLYIDKEHIKINGQSTAFLQ